MKRSLGLEWVNQVNYSNVINGGTVSLGYRGVCLNRGHKEMPAVEA